MSSAISFYVPVMHYLARDVVIGNLSRLGEVKDIRFVEKQVPNSHCIDCFVDYHRLYANYAHIPRIIEIEKYFKLNLVSFIVDYYQFYDDQYLTLHPNTGCKVVPGERKECIQINQPAIVAPINIPVPKSNKDFRDLMNNVVVAKLEEQDYYNMDEIDAYLTRDLDECMQKELEMEDDLESFWDDIDGVNAFLEEQQITQYIASLVIR